MKKAFIAILMVLLIAMFLTACGPVNNDNEIDKKGEDDGSWKEITNASDDVVYGGLLASINNSLEEMSSKKVKNNNNFLSVDSKFKLEINKLSYFLELKMNYDHKNPQKIIASIELIDEVDNIVVLGAYFKDDKLYVSLKDGEIGKIIFPLNSEVISDLLPIKSDIIDSSTITKLKAGLKDILVLNGNITGRQRMDGTQKECEYVINIDLPKTLKKILSIDQGILPESFDIELLSNIIKNVLRIDDTNFDNGTFDANMVIKFSTLGIGTSDCKLQTFKLNIDMDADSSVQNGIFEADSIKIALELEKLNIKNGTKSSEIYTSIPFFGGNDFETFPNYFEQTFGVLLNIKQKGETSEYDKDFLFKAEAMLDLDVIENNQVSIELLNVQDGESLPIAGIYVFDSVFYLYQYEDTIGYNKKFEFEIDFLEIFDIINSGMNLELPNIINNESNTSTTVLEYISYLIGAIQLTDNKFIFTVNEDFYDIILPDVVEFISYLELLTGQDIQGILDGMEFNIINFLMTNVFEIYIDFSEDAQTFIYTLSENISFPDGVDGRVIEER